MSSADIILASDSMLSILQISSGIPVGTMAAGKSGRANAVLCALNILSVSDSQIEAKLDACRKNIAEKISDKNKKIAEMGLMNYIKKLEAEK